MTSGIQGGECLFGREVFYFSTFVFSGLYFSRVHLARVFSILFAFPRVFFLFIAFPLVRVFRCLLFSIVFCERVKSPAHLLPY